MGGPFEYPAVPRGDVSEVIHGREIADPYRALEDPDAPGTQKFCEAQNAVTESYLKRAPRFRARVKHSLEKLMNYDKYSVAWKEGEYYYYSHHQGLANQAVVYQCQKIDASDARVFIDPNTLSEDGTAALDRLAFSVSGRYCVYGVRRSGSDWADLFVMDAHTLEKLPDVLEWAKFCSVAWTHDNAGFYYTRYPAPDSLKDVDREKRGAETDESQDQAVYYHRIGTTQSEDRVVIPADPDNRKNLYSIEITDDGKYLLLTVNEDCAPRNKFWYVDVTTHFGAEAEKLVRLIDTYEARYGYVANDDTLFYLSTNLNAPKNKLITVDLSEPERSQWKEVIPEHPQRVLSTVLAVNHEQLALVYMQDASERLFIHALKNGELVAELPLPDLGQVSIWGRRKLDFLTFKFSSFLYPGTVYYCDLTMPAGDGTRVFRQMAPPGFDSSKYHTRQVWYESKDGTKVPMFVVGSKEEPENAKYNRPVLLYGYGGFCISMTPFFSTRLVSWLQSLNGLFVVANIRGGDEYGDEWHSAGIIDKKQNVFDDFQWAAKALVQMGIAVPGKICIMGGSNGGLLVGACVNQAPELFGAAVAQVGVFDMVRFAKFTIGSAWVSDFGSPDKPDEFEHLVKYSPLHNTFSPGDKGVPYPAILLATGSHDDRVVPLHSLKFAATLQWRVSSSDKDFAVQGDVPVLLRVDVKAGHGAGKPTSKVIDEMADTLTFAALALKTEGVD